MVVTEYHGKFVGGRLCLDFINTVAGRTEKGGVIREKIGGLAELKGWAQAAGIGGWRDADGDESLVERARRLREALYRTFTRRLEAEDVELVGAEVAEARAHQKLEMRGAKFVFEIKDGDGAERILWEVALSAAELLVSAEAGRVRQCGGADCRWLFLDSSRNGQRRWCDMRDCGNRAKVRSFRERAIRGA